MPVKGSAGMNEPVIASRKPYLTAVQAGKAYYWCACGKSAKQPFCDGSHKDTGFEPVKFVPEEDGELLFCGCKRTGAAPICDGSHNALPGVYGEDVDEVEAELIARTPNDKNSGAKTELDGGCYVLSPADIERSPHGNLSLAPLVTAADGAKFLSAFCFTVAPGEAPPLGFGDSDAVLFLRIGDCECSLSGRNFPLSGSSGLYVRPGEGLTIRNTGSGPAEWLAVVCPGVAALAVAGVGGGEFDEEFPERVATLDADQRTAMGDRFYQVLIGEETGSREVTLFIGEIPQSRAGYHHHLYEEVIGILSGEGYMWTGSKKTPVAPGDVIFLPAKQMHALECTSPEGMQLMGAFYPAGSPAINY